MACNLKRVVDLPIREEYKMALLEYFQKPENAEACDKFTNAPPEQIMALIQDMEKNIGGGQGQPPAPAAGPAVQPPGPPGEGIAAIPQAPPRQQTPPGVPPGQLANVPMPMDIPPGGIAGSGPPRRY